MTSEHITQLLNYSAYPSPRQIRGLLSALRKLAGKSELPELDFKQQFDDDNRSWLELVKDIVSLSNYGGGLLLFGVKNDGSWRGLPMSIAKTLDPATVIRKVQRHARHARMTIVYVETTYYRRRFGLMRVQPAPHITVFDSDGDYVDDAGRPRKAFYKGVVYTRVSGGNCEASQADLDRMVEIAANRKVASLLAKIEKIAYLPEQSQLVAQDPKQPTKGYVLVRSGEGTPVRIVPDEEEATLSLREIISTDQPFSSMDAEVAGQVRQWAQSDRRHRIGKATLASWYLQRDSLSITDDVAEFCLLSAAHNFGFPMFWAQRMSRARLKRALREQLRLAEYPTVNVLPYLVCAFFWGERSALLQAESLRLPKQARGTVQRLCRLTDYEMFRREGRLRARTAALEGRRIALESLYAGDYGGPQQVFETLIKRDARGKCGPGERQLANQLDVFLHGRPREK